MEPVFYTRFSEEEFKELVSDIVKDQLQHQNQSLPELLLTRKEVSKKLCISLPTLQRYSELNILTPHKIGNRIYFLWSEILNAAKKIESSQTK